jgi:type VI secretion system protein VasI
MKNIIRFIIFSLFIGGASAESNVPEQLAQCQNIAEDAQRLGCFDQIGKSKDAAKIENAEPQSVGKWEVSTDKSPIDDSKNVFVYLSAEDQIRGQFHQAITPSLAIVCREKKTDLYIDWSTFLGIESTRVLTRLDTKKATTRSWLLSTNNKATFYSGQTIAFIKELMKSEKIFVQVTPYGDNAAQTTFDLTGLSNAIKPLREACKW